MKSIYKKINPKFNEIHRLIPMLVHLIVPIGTQVILTRELHSSIGKSSYLSVCKNVNNEVKGTK